MEIAEYRQDGFIISTAATRIDLVAVHSSLSRSYWAKNILIEMVAKSVRNSLCFGVYEEASGAQIGLARVISDYATYAYLADVYILEEYRGRGLSKWLMRCIVDHPELQTCRTFSLATRDAHSLYSQFGFTPLEVPERFMVRRNPAVYRDGAYVVMTTILGDDEGS